MNQRQALFPLKEAVPQREGVSVELVTKRDGFEYELVVTPDPSLKATMIPIVIHPEKPDGLKEVKTFTVYGLFR